MFLVGYMNLRAVSGSSELSVGCGVEASGDEEHAEAVVLDVAEPAGDAAAQLDDPGLLKVWLTSGFMPPVLRLVS